MRRVLIVAWYLSAALVGALIGYSLGGVLPPWP